MTEISSPYSTGGGGTTFEQLVGAYYLAALLAGDPPRGLGRGICSRVLFQQRLKGAELDDIIVETSDEGVIRKLALQVKHDIRVSDASSNTLFAEVMAACWRTFTNQTDWRFDPLLDHIGIAVGTYNAKQATVEELQKHAWGSADAQDWLTKLDVPNAVSDKVREMRDVFRNQLDTANGTAVTAEQFWTFTKSLVFLHFDIENDSGRDMTSCRSRLLDQIIGRDSGKADLLFAFLKKRSAELARSAGGVDAPELRRSLPRTIILKDDQRCERDFSALRKHSRIIRDAVRDVIGSDLRVPRSDVLRQIKQARGQTTVLAVTGEPFVGKSVVMAQLFDQNPEATLLFSVERLDGASIDSFLSGIGVHAPFEDLLAGFAGERHLVIIDKCELTFDDTKKRLVEDLARAVLRHNRNAMDANPDDPRLWTLALCCRQTEAIDALRTLYVISTELGQEPKEIRVGSFSDAEVALVLAEYPNLAYLGGMKRLNDLLTRPLVLDILTRPYIAFATPSMPTIPTESWLMRRIIDEIIRRPDGTGNPNDRMRLFTQVAQSCLARNTLTTEQIRNHEPLQGLLTDQVLRVEDNTVHFVHDAYQDWALADQLLQSHQRVASYLLGAKNDLMLNKPFSLYMAYLLEIERNIAQWDATLNEVSQVTGLSPRWRRIALATTLQSPDQASLLALLEPRLLDKNGAVLAELLKVLRTTFVKPHPAIEVLFKTRPQAELEKLLAEITYPDWPYWIPIVRFALDHASQLVGATLYEFSFVAKAWMMNSKSDAMFRKDIGQLALNLLIERMSEGSSLGLVYHKEENAWSNLIYAALWAADCLPEAVAEFVMRFGPRSDQEQMYGFEDILLDNGWIPLCAPLPHVVTEVFKRIMCEPFDLDDYGDWFRIDHDLGLRGTNWHPPTPFKGPFYALLKSDISEGLRLMHTVVSHATAAWKSRSEHRQLHLLPNVVHLRSKDIEVWGDQTVYQWFRYPSCAPNEVTCPLMALEVWMSEQIESGIDPDSLFERVLAYTDSVAVVGVCTSVALKHFNKCLHAIVPILREPSFWHMDVQRWMYDQTSVSFVEQMIIKPNLRGKEDGELLKRMAEEPHRKTELRNFVPAILFGTDEELRSKLQEAIRSFPDRIPFAYAEQKDDVNYINDQKETLTIWAAQAERENYHWYRTEDNSVIVQFELPEDLRLAQRQIFEHLAEEQQLTAFLMWSIELRDKGTIGQSYTLETALDQAKGFVAADNPKAVPSDFHSDNERRVWALAAYAAGILMHQQEWVQQQGLFLWIRQQILVSATRPEPVRDALWGASSRFSMWYRCSAAMALPVLMALNPRDRAAERAVVKLAVHPNDEVRGYLFDSLRSTQGLSNSLIMKACVRLAVLIDEDQAKHTKEQHKWAKREWWKPDRREQREWKGWQSLMRVFRIARLKMVTARKGLLLAYPSTRAVNPAYVNTLTLLLPSGRALTEGPRASLMLYLLEQIERFTVQGFLEHEPQDSSHSGYNEWAHLDLSRLVVQRVAHALLFLSSQSRATYLDPILNKWESVPSMLAELQRQVLIAAHDWYPNQASIVVELWHTIADKVLSSPLTKDLRYYVEDDLKNVVGLLIFTDPRGLIKWPTREWGPVTEMHNIVNCWCTRMSSHPDCFAILIDFLSSIGFQFMPGQGIEWLYNAVQSAKDPADLLKRRESAGRLAELLHDTWSENSAAIVADTASQTHFSFLVDYVAQTGDRLAIELQARIQEAIC